MESSVPLSLIIPVGPHPSKLSWAPLNNTVLDPWDSSQNFILNLGINLLKGPISNPKDKNSRYIIEFLYENKGDNIYYLERCVF